MKRYNRHANLFRLSNGLIIVHPLWCFNYNGKHHRITGCHDFILKAHHGESMIETECVGCDLYQGEMKSEVENE